MMPRSTAPLFAALCMLATSGALRHEAADVAALNASAVDFCAQGHKVPQFFLVGQPKCGTTYFFDAFSKSPGLAFYKPKPQEPDFKRKEPWIFRGEYSSMKKDWRSHYPACAAASQKVGVDCTPGYFGDEFAPSNVHRSYRPELLPHIVFMVFLREPVQRSHSHYYQYQDHGVTKGNMAGCTVQQYPPSFEAAAKIAIKNNGVICDCACDGMIRASFYAVGFRRWFETFEARQFHVVPFKMAVGKPIVEYAWRLLGVPPFGGGVIASDEKKNGHSYPPIEEDLRPETRAAFREFMDSRAGPREIAKVLHGSGANLFKHGDHDSMESIQQWLEDYW